jgi:hypothetical protein
MMLLHRGPVLLYHPNDVESFSRFSGKSFLVSANNRRAISDRRPAQILKPCQPLPSAEVHGGDGINTSNGMRVAARPVKPVAFVHHRN